MPEKGSLFFLVGLPRSGKSLFANRWVNYKDSATEYCKNRGETFKPRAIICGDDFRTALYGRTFQAEAEGTVFSMMDVAARALLLRGHDVIIDETSTTLETIKRYLRIDIEATPIIIRASIGTCIGRAVIDRKEYLVKPIERMNAQLDKLLVNLDYTLGELKKEIMQRKGQDISI